MKGIIDHRGGLAIIRAGVEKEQFCMFENPESIHCSDACPAFDDGVSAEGKTLILNCCNSVIEIIRDEREKNPEILIKDLRDKMRDKMRLAEAEES